MLSRKWPSADGKEAWLQSCPSVALRCWSYLCEEVTPPIGIQNRHQGTLLMVGPTGSCMAQCLGGGAWLEPWLLWVSMAQIWVSRGPNLSCAMTDVRCVTSTHALDVWCDIAALSSITPQGFLLNFALGGQCSHCLIQYPNSSD